MFTIYIYSVIICICKDFWLSMCYMGVLYGQVLKTNFIYVFHFERPLTCKYEINSLPLHQPLIIYYDKVEISYSFYVAAMCTVYIWPRLKGEACPYCKAAKRYNEIEERLYGFSACV